VTRLEIASQLGYGDILPTGEYAVNVTGVGLRTHLGLLPFPSGETTGVLFPVITARVGFEISGQRASASTIGAPHYVNGTWETDTRLPVGTRPCIFDNTGLLHVSQGEVGAQGYRYVTPANVLMTGDQTYAARNGVAEWTDLSILQDGSMLLGWAQWTFALVLWDGAHHRLVDAVDATAKNVNAHRSGDLISIAYARAAGAVLLQMTVSELLAMPVFEPTPPDPQPQPPEPEPQPPQPEPQPPEPEPQPPQPEPQPPEPSMLYIYTSVSSFAVEECQKIDNGDGTIAAQRTKDNKFLSRDSGGAVKWSDVVGGDEKFTIVGKKLLSKNYFPDTAHQTFYLFPFEEL
jgi:hypothetical protein